MSVAVANSTASFFVQLTRLGGYPTKDDGSHFSYNRYRLHIAADCGQRCVYCDMHENEVGGPESMQLDHFRPESFREFEHLANDPLNLHYACGRCNLFKSNHWPARGTPYTHDGESGFIDPFVENRAEYFRIRSDGTIEPVKPPARYIIGLLHLDREHLRKLRLLRILVAELRARKAVLLAELDAGKQVETSRFRQILEAYDRVIGLFTPS